MAKIRKLDEVKNPSYADFDGPAYYKLDAPDAAKQSADALSEFCVVQRNKSTAGNYYRYDYSNVGGNGVSGRPGLTPADYYAFRPEEGPPSSNNGLLSECNRVYKKVGVIRNIIDLMGDFAAQGVRVVCTNKNEQKVYRKWFNKIKGKERSERFLNNFYRTGNVYVRILTAMANIKTKRYLSKAEVDADFPEEKIEKREIPAQYVFLDPRTISVVGGGLSSFVGVKNYQLTIPAGIKRMINAPKSSAEKELIALLPNDILNAAKSNRPYVLPPGKVRAFFYKKDDWDTLGSPMIEAILDDINVLEKLKLADLSALDGATANIRIFKLGSLEHNVAPTRANAAKLASILQNNVGSGTYDIIWGPDIELIESNSNIFNFLGEEKYRPHLNNIYSGLGIPPTLTGTFGASGTTNNFISLKTLIERLQYGRDTLMEFWDFELEKVQKALGLKNKAKIEYNRTNLADDTNEKALWIQLIDRGIVSEELLQYIFGADPDMEVVRLAREAKERKSGKRDAKAGAFHDPMFEISLRKIALQAGYITPEQAGVEMQEEKSGKTPFEMQIDIEKKKALTPPTGPGGVSKTPKKKGVPGSGRPLNKKDSTKRKTKKISPRTKAVEVWATEAQNKIAEIVNPLILETYSKKNMRSLSEKEFENSENIKFGVLTNLEPLSEINDEVVFAALNKGGVSKDISDKYIYLKNAIALEINRQPTSDEQRRIQAMVYSSSQVIKNEDI